MASTSPATNVATKTDGRSAHGQATAAATIATAML